MKFETNEAARHMGVPAATLADQLERLPKDETHELVSQLPPAQAAAVVSELEAADAVNLVEALPDNRVAAVIEFLPRTVATDRIGSLPEDRRANILAALPPEKAAGVSTLLRYPPESDGGIMDTRFVAVRVDETTEASLGLQHFCDGSDQHNGFSRVPGTGDVGDVEIWLMNDEREMEHHPKQ
jgi:Mg/Co/Ni transporter MgtE